VVDCVAANLVQAIFPSSLKAGKKKRTVMDDGDNAYISSSLMLVVVFYIQHWTANGLMAQFSAPWISLPGFADRTQWFSVSNKTRVSHKKW
jgi:hypothetical protein